MNECKMSGRLGQDPKTGVTKNGIQQERQKQRGMDADLVGYPGLGRSRGERGSGPEKGLESLRDRRRQEREVYRQARCGKRESLYSRTGNMDGAAAVVPCKRQRYRAGGGKHAAGTGNAKRTGSLSEIRRRPCHGAAEPRRLCGRRTDE